MRNTTGYLALARLLAVPLLVVLTLFNCFYTIQPTEHAGIRRFGNVITQEPIGPGLHTKIPFVDQVDRLQTSVDLLKIAGLNVYTIDNQKVTVDIGMTFQIPTEAVLKLLYGVGRSGNVDIDANLQPIIADRALRIFAKRNTINISEQRDAIATEIQADVGEHVHNLFGLKILDFQISRIEYSRQFVESVESAVKAKNDAVAAENTVNRIRYEGQQTVVKAEADAKAHVTAAEAAKQVAIFAAEGEAQRIRLQGDAEAEAIAKRGAAIRGNPGVVELTLAQRWNGDVPQTVVGSGGAAAAPFIRLDATTTNSAKAAASAQ